MEFAELGYWLRAVDDYYRAAEQDAGRGRNINRTESE